jgi:putative flippase GtrA
MIKYIKRFMSRKIFKFGIVGIAGTLTNLIIFFILVDLLKFNATIVSIITFSIAVTQNYILNHVWTFHEITKDENVSFTGYVKFVLTSLLGLAVNLIVLNIIIYFFNIPLKVIAQGFGIFSGMIFNFIGSKFFVFRKKS